jgi:DnaK suppressor protein
VNVKEIRKALENEHKRLTIEMELHSVSRANQDREISPFNKKFEAANQITELDQNLAKVRMMKQQITDIEHALDKIDRGTYGICDICGKPIAGERLKVLPQANSCMACKAS